MRRELLMLLMLLRLLLMKMMLVDKTGRWQIRPNNPSEREGQLPPILRRKWSVFMVVVAVGLCKMPIQLRNDYIFE